MQMQMQIQYKYKYKYKNKNKHHNYGLVPWSIPGFAKHNRHASILFHGRTLDTQFHQERRLAKRSAVKTQGVVDHGWW